MFKKCFYVSNKGNRSSNEDKYQINTFASNGDDTFGHKYLFCPSLFSVSDGMGGEEDGEIASQIVTRELAKIVPQKIDVLKMNIIIESINNMVVDKMKSRKCRMGATLVSCLLKRKTMDIYNIGDSRAYLLNKKNSLIQLTKDHISKSNNGLMQHIGMTPEDGKIEPFYLNNIDIKHKELLLLCSDGLYNMVNETELIEILSSKKKLIDKCKELLNRAMKNGGKDNITFILVRL